MSEERASTDPGQDPFVWWNGALCASSEVRISPFDHGLLVGDGIFETVRVYGGQPFAWRRHLERLEHSAAGLGLGLPAREELRTAAEAVLQANDLLEARLRITVTGGLSPLGSERGQAPPTLIVAASEVVPGADATTVAISPWPRNEHGATAGLKTTSYAENVRALTYARELGATEAILENTQHQLCEATGSNVFVVSEGIVRTPPPSSGCLLGVTRALVLELGPQLGLRVEETPLPLHALIDDADEAFLTSTVREVQGIAEIAGWGHTFTDAPGPVTRTLAAAFDDLIATNLDP
jgi:branched-chain amino acid aminotransferase